MEQSPSSGDERSLASQEIKRPPFFGIRRFRKVPIVSEMFPAHILTPYLRSILILSSRLCTILPNIVFRSGYPTTTLYAFICQSLWFAPQISRTDVAVMHSAIWRYLEKSSRFEVRVYKP